MSTIDNRSRAGPPGDEPPALDRFSAALREALAEAAERQRKCLSVAEDCLTEVTQRPRAAMGPGPEAVQALKAKITGCVADAAAENVMIWTRLTERVLQGCAQLDRDAGLDNPDAHRPDGAGDPAGLGARQ